MSSINCILEGGVLPPSSTLMEDDFLLMFSFESLIFGVSSFKSGDSSSLSSLSCQAWIGLSLPETMTSSLDAVAATFLPAEVMSFLVLAVLIDFVF